MRRHAVYVAVIVVVAAAWVTFVTVLIVQTRF